MKRIIVGTAGHIDHGKTTLIRALTGIDCDRLKEEKERGITTELGFAHWHLDDDLLVGIVDVPGHEKFVRHMVAGAWGIDTVLIVVAADEGVMPQTREHLDICEMLGLTKGIVVITKKDLVDEEMVQLVEEDVKDFLQGRALENAPVVAVSATTGENLEVLKAMLRDISTRIEEKSREGIFRLPVDRVFTLRGLGTIVTGTCISGSLGVGEEVELFPFTRKARVRSIQAYHDDVKEATAGQRIALNLQGLDRQDVERGSMVARPDTLLLTSRIDASLRLLKLAIKPIRHDSILRFHIATTQEEARLVLLETDQIEPGQELFVQFVFKKPIVVLPGDRFILRGSYAIQTVGGGRVLDIMPSRHKRKAEGLGNIYHILNQGTDLEKTAYHVSKGGFRGVRQQTLSILTGKDVPSIQKTGEVLGKKSVATLVGKTYLHKRFFDAYQEKIVAFVGEYHKVNPLKIGIPKEELRSRLPATDVQVFQTALDECAASGRIVVEKDRVGSRDHAKGTGQTDEFEKRVLAALLASGFTPPGLKDLAGTVGVTEKNVRELLERLAFRGGVVKVAQDMFFHRDMIEELKEKATNYLRNHHEMGPSDFKSELNLSRKFLIPLLEYLDQIKLTIRKGDKRVLRG
ncbi:MAG: selenocysteine-specific translation elongation factor [Syntrophorhabdaceae bacterium]|nr:selenocysteine-specific translation elongation factor [Syntrophorhabdaceae bacterium]